MLTYYIESKSGIDKKLLREDGALDPTKEEDREAFFLRALKRCYFSKGQHVRVHGTQQKGIITKIIRNFKDVQWDNDVANFLEVKWSSGKSTMCAPSQLTAKRAR